MRQRIEVLITTPLSIFKRKYIMTTQSGRVIYASAFFLWLFITPGYESRAQNSGMPANKVFGREYRVGDTYRYKLTMEELHNGKWDHTNIAICELRVIKDSLGIPYD